MLTGCFISFIRVILARTDTYLRFYTIVLIVFIAIVNYHFIRVSD
jgi:hypothetical protein